MMAGEMRISLIAKTCRTVLAGLLVLGCQAVLAGPPEDFSVASKAYASGDLIGSMPVLRRSADAGYAPAQALLAEILYRSEFDEEAVGYYRKAADQGNADGQFGLGSMYSTGEGVKKDLAAARHWISLAAEQGHKQAIGVMAQAHMSGQLGITEKEQQSEEALRWIKRAAETDYLPAVDALAVAYRNGTLGLAADATAADQWQAKANELRGIKAGKGKGKGRNKEIKK